MKSILTAASLLLAITLATTPSAIAQNTQSVLASVDSQDFSDKRGSLRSAMLEYKIDLGDTTVLASPTIGERRVAGTGETAFGIGATVYHDWSHRVSTRTQAFVAKDAPVFAHLDFAQDVSLKVADSTTMTAGARWAKYFAGREVTFMSLGIRRYFKGGSMAYRLTRVNPDDRDAFFGHMVNLTVSDGRGKGKTQVWLSTGASSLVRSQLEDNFAGKDRAILIQRTQPLTGKLALIASAGLSSYARPRDRINSSTFGLGLSVAID